MYCSLNKYLLSMFSSSTFWWAAWLRHCFPLNQLLEPACGALLSIAKKNVIEMIRTSEKEYQRPYRAFKAFPHRHSDKWNLNNHMYLKYFNSLPFPKNIHEIVIVMRCHAKDVIHIETDSFIRRKYIIHTLAQLIAKLNR